MNPKLRPFYLFAGFLGLGYLIFYIMSTIADINPLNTLLISVPDMVFFFLAYKTYPAEAEEPRRQKAA
jgi:hypothetical protein